MNKTIKKIIFSMIILFMILLINTTTVKAGIASVNQEGSVGANYTLSFSDMCSTNSGLYCLESHQANSGSATYKVLVYIHIEDGVATMSDINGDNRTAEGEENKVLAQILSGEYGGGYGTAAYKYTDAQCALYVFFEEWATSTGLVNNSWYGNNNPDADTISRGHATVAKARAAVAAGANPSADIYLLDVFDGHDSSAWQRLLYAIPSIKDEEPKPATGNGKVIIKGNTSVVGGSGKDSQSAKTIPGGNDTVKVWWKAEEGKRTLGYTEIKLGESYQFESGIDIRDHFYYPNPAQVEMYNNSYVEFEYNGLKYTTNNLNGRGDGEIGEIDISLEGQYNTAKENVGYRNSADGKYSSVSSNQSEIAQEQNNLVRASTKGIVTNLIEKVKTHAKEQGGAQNDWLKITQTWCMNGMDGNPDWSSCLSHEEIEGLTDKCHDGDLTPESDKHSSHKYWVWKYGTRDPITGQRPKWTEQETHDPCADADKYNSVYAIGPDGEVWTPDVWIINGMNLQLIPREMADAALESDISNVKVIMNEQEYTYEYGNRGIKQLVASPSVEFSEDNKTYSRPINPASVRQVVRDNDQNSLQLYVTYNINAYNQANTLYTQILNVINYYDSDKYVLATEEECSKYNLPSNIGWDASDASTGGTYKAYSHSTTQETDGSGNKLYPILTDKDRSWTDAGGKELQITYKVKYNVISDFCHRGEELLYNVSEIGSFKPMYGQDTVYAEHAHDGARKYNTYAAVDYDSTPANANPQSNKDVNIEDDSDIAPIFRIIFDDNKIVTGTVWEDNSEVDTSNGTRNGNGKNENEKTVSNVRVELIDVTTGKIAKLYPLEVRNSEDTNSPKRDEDLIKEGNTNAKKVTDYLARYPVGDTKEGIRSYKAITYTDKDGNYSFEGVPENEYIIKYTYGDNEETITSGFSNEQKNNITQKANGKIVTTVDGATAINARNYKSTIITNDTIKALMKKSRNNYTDTDYKWHLRNDIDNSSIAVDDLNERLKISDLENSNFETPQTITAYSIPFKIQVEYDYNGDYTNQNYKVKDNGTKQDKQDNGGNFTYTWSTFDFGIVERARESLIVDKTINNLKVTLANGQILTEGNPYGKDNLSYVKAIGEKGIITKRNEVANNTAKDRNLYIEIDSELIQGATIDITYAITVTDNNETDYEYSNSGTNGEYNDITGVNHITTGTNASYYYYGEAGNLQTIRPSVKLIADYMDQELTCDVNDSQNKDYGWKQALAKQENGSYYLDYSDNKDGSERISISKETYDVMQDTTNGNYLIFVTDYFKDIHSLAEKRTQNKSVYEPNEYKTNENQKTAYLHASKLLANQTNYVYENHAEILKIDGKVARNIDSTDGGKQIEKTYKPGNYVPSLKQRSMDKNADIEIAKVHEQDDDMITVRITPPTGLTNYTTLYIIVGGITLTVLAVGVIIIKRKVLA